jgi:protein-L-isoaspartate(D-aspartate) O-methyltransferase
MMSLDILRRLYAERIAATAGTTDARIIDAFATVRREQFVGPGPWQVKASSGYKLTPTADPSVLYEDILIALAPERGINNGEPSLHARCLDEAAVQAGDHVIHVGAGTGYYTAILATLAGPNGRVDAYELAPDLAARAATNLAGFSTVRVDARSAVDAGVQPANVIYVNAGVTHLPSAWLDALLRGGRMVVPLTSDSGPGCMLLVTRLSDTAFAARLFSSASFIPCAGARSANESRALATALRERAWGEVRSLRRSGTPDATAWCTGDGWWLSTAPPDPAEGSAQ